MMLPRVERIDGDAQEDFQSYRKKWPSELGHVPDNVIEEWVYRHHEQFLDGTFNCYNLEKWNFELIKFNNSEILEVSHFSDEVAHLDENGERLIKGEMKGYYPADFMLENGTFPSPIIVAKNAGKHKHAKSLGNETMVEPYHLIEGHRRLAFIRGLIKHGHANLKDSHEVWLVTIND